MRIDIASVCALRGLTKEEIAALLGVCRTTCYRMTQSGEHRKLTEAFFLCLREHHHEMVSTLLYDWLNREPRDDEHVRVLIGISKRYLGRVNARSYESKMRRLYPQFFF
jgi:predicted transcriptional regulator